MKRVLVTGGAGFIGSTTVVALHQAGFLPIIIDNLSNSDSSVLGGIKQLTGRDIPFYQGNYQDKTLLARVFKEQIISSVIHFAAYKAVSESVEQPLKYYDNNVVGFTAMLEFLLERNVKNFVFSSSAAVYGDPPTDKVTEETACQPVSPYGWSKYMDEVILRDTCAANPKLKGIALRYFNVVGGHESAAIGELPKGRPQNLLPLVMQAAQGKIPPLTVFGKDYPTPDGTCLRDYIHVMDLAEAHVAALQKILDEESGYNVYNLGAGKPTSVLELINTFEKVNGAKVPHTIGARRPGDPVAYYAVPDKAKHELGWAAKRTIEDAVRDAWRWQQKLAAQKA